MERIEVEIERLPGSEDLPLPQYMSEGASAMDVHAALSGSTVLDPGEIALIPTGLAIAVPPGHECQVRSRSGLALEHGVVVLNSPGTVDSDYRGEVGVILANLGSAPFTVARGDRIAQLVVARVSEVAWIEKTKLPSTARQDGGFGHTGRRRRDSA